MPRPRSSKFNIDDFKTQADPTPIETTDKDMVRTQRMLFLSGFFALVCGLGLDDWFAGFLLVIGIILLILFGATFFREQITELIDNL